MAALITRLPFRRNCPTAQSLASEISDLKTGSVLQVYVTSDGGASFDDIVKMLSLLDAHVKVVDHKTLIDMALQRG